MQDLEYLKKLLTYIGSKNYEGRLFISIKDNALLLKIPSDPHSNYYSLIFYLDTPNVFHWQTWIESYHNGSIYNEKKGEIILEDKDYIDLIKYLEDKAYKKAEKEYKELQEKQRKNEVTNFLNSKLDAI